MRFRSLDALRGVCALIVVLFHVEVISEIFSGLIHGSGFFEHGFLFVDFFFVLSGFVLAHTYLNKLSDVNDVLAFITRRFGRVYPLHLFFLAVFIGLELIKLYMYARGIHAKNVPFEGAYGVDAIFTNIFLIQAFGLHSVATWNSPSWSIGVEFYTYILFAIVAVFFGKKRISFALYSLILAVLGASVLYLFSEYYIDSTYDYAFFRCMFGFFCGTFTYVASAKVRGKMAGTGWLYSVIEGVALCGCVAFVAKTGTSSQSLLAPVVFAMAITVFSLEKGRISALLATRPLQFLGDISYTIYISHAFVLLVVARIFRVLQQKTSLISSVSYTAPQFHESVTDLMVPISPAVSNLVVLLILAAVIGVSAVVNRLIEVPCRDYFNRLSRGLTPLREDRSGPFRLPAP